MPDRPDPPRRGTLIESRWARAGAYRLHYRATTGPGGGDAPPVVLLHGVGLSYRYMEPLARALGRHVRVLVPDLPGFGSSDNPDRTLDTAGNADVIAAWLRVIGRGPVVAVGNSYGSQIAVELAIRHPALVAGLVLDGMTIDPEARTWYRQVWRFLLDAPREPFGQWLIVLRDYPDCGIRRIVGTLRAALAHPIEERLCRVQQPALVVRGERDPIMPQRWAERATRLLPGAELCVVPGAAHVVNYSHPDELAALTLGLMRASGR